jgi:transposase-like protein
VGPKKDNDSSKVKRKNTNIMTDVKKQIIAKHENGVRASELATEFGMAKSTISTILKNRETIKKADVARGVTVITKQRLQTIEEVCVKNLCTKYCCKSLNKQSSGVQERINPFYINSYGENSFGLRTFWFTNDLQERIKFVKRGLTVLSTAIVLRSPSSMCT